MAGLGRKVFTAGQVLAAADVQGYLQDQSTMVFADSTVRGTAIGTAVSEGMMSYLANTNQVEIYDGSTWRPEAGLALINKTDFAAVSSLFINNVFSSLYNNYKIELEYTQNSANSDFFTQFSIGGTVTATTYGFNNFLIYQNGTTAAQTSSGFGGISLPIAGATVSNQVSSSLTVSNPNVATRTFLKGQSFSSASGNGYNNHYVIGGAHSASTVFDGIVFYVPSGNFTGTIRIYGVRNI